MDAVMNDEYEPQHVCKCLRASWHVRCHIELSEMFLGMLQYHVVSSSYRVRRSRASGSEWA